MSKELYSRKDLGDLAAVKRETFKSALGLTGTEISFNNLPAGASIPFVHSHKRNEEVYLFISGRGEFSVDGKAFPVKAGSVVRVSPAGKRCIRAFEQLGYFCIQADENSLVQSTESDGVINEDQPSWN